MSCFALIPPSLQTLQDKKKLSRDHTFSALSSVEDELSCLHHLLKGTAAGQPQLQWFGNPPKWTKTLRLVLAPLLFLTPPAGRGHTRKTADVGFGHMDKSRW